MGNLHSAYTFSYAFFMFFNGMLAERMNMRYYLTLGLLTTALADYLFGFGHTAGIHSIYYYYACQVLRATMPSLFQLFSPSDTLYQAAVMTRLLWGCSTRRAGRAW